MITDVTPQLTLQPTPAGVVCKSNDIEFEVTLDAQMNENNQSAFWFPVICEAEYSIEDGAQSHIPHQTGTVLLNLVNNSGLYKGIIRSSNLQVPTNTNSSFTVKVEIKQGSNARLIFGNIKLDLPGPHLFINPCLKPRQQKVTQEITDSLHQEKELIQISERSNSSGTNPVKWNNAYLNLSLHPNPFTGEIMVEYGFGGEEDSDITLRVLDITGQTQYVLLDEQPHSLGAYRLSFNGCHLSAGVYWFELTTKQGLRQVKKAVKTKI